MLLGPLSGRGRAGVIVIWPSLPDFRSFAKGCDISWSTVDQPQRRASRCGLFRRELPARGVEGTGLGLYVASQVVARHGGTIAVESAPGDGSVFTIRLPLAAPALQADTAARDSFEVGDGGR